MKRFRSGMLALMLGLGATVFESCPLNDLSDCFDEDTISQEEYDELGAFEQLLYQENDCNRYEPRF